MKRHCWMVKMATSDFYSCRISPRVSRAAVNFGPQSLTIPPGRRSTWKYFETICSHNVKVSKTSRPVVSGRLIRCRYHPLPWHTWQVNNFKWRELATGMSFMQSWWPSLWLDPHHCYYSSSGLKSWAVWSNTASYSLRHSLQDKTRQDKTRQDKTRQDKTRQDKTRQDKTRQDKTRQDKTRQDKTRQDKTRQDKTRQDKTRQDKTRQDKTRQRQGHAVWHDYGIMQSQYQQNHTQSYGVLGIRDTHVYAETRRGFYFKIWAQNWDCKGRSNSKYLLRDRLLLPQDICEVSRFACLNPVK